MTSMDHQPPQRKIVIGVDTHKYVHVAVALDELGGRLGDLTVPADRWMAASWFGAESFFATLETELIDRQAWRTRADARLAVFDFIEAWYNPHRRRSFIGQLSPAEYERRYRSEPPAA